MKQREIFSLLVCCRECTYDVKGKDDSMERKYHIDESQVDTLAKLQKDLEGLKPDAQKEFRDYQEKVLKNRQVYQFKYPDLMEKAEKLFDPKLLDKKIKRKGDNRPVTVTTEGAKKNEVDNTDKVSGN